MKYGSFHRVYPFIYFKMLFQGITVYLYCNFWSFASLLYISQNLFILQCAAMHCYLLTATLWSYIYLNFVGYIISLSTIFKIYKLFPHWVNLSLSCLVLSLPKYILLLTWIWGSFFFLDFLFAVTKAHKNYLNSLCKSNNFNCFFAW